MSKHKLIFAIVIFLVTLLITFFSVHMYRESLPQLSNLYTDNSLREMDFFLEYASIGYYSPIVRLGGDHRSETRIASKDGKMVLPEGMIINITYQDAELKKQFIDWSVSDVREFVKTIETATVKAKSISKVSSRELYVLVLNTSAEYSLLIISLKDDKKANCRILSENEYDNATEFILESEQLINRNR